jgi:hypothetical protein
MHSGMPRSSAERAQGVRAREGPPIQNKESDERELPDPSRSDAPAAGLVTSNAQPIVHHPTTRRRI